MNNRSKLLIIGATSIAIAAGGTSFALAGGGDDDSGDSEAPISAGALDQASAAALNEVDGTVTETEVGDEESYYEVEVTRADGSEVDVQLNRDFDVVGQESDAGESDDD